MVPLAGLLDGHPGGPGRRFAGGGGGRLAPLTPRRARLLGVCLWAALTACRGSTPAPPPPPPLQVLAAETVARLDVHLRCGALHRSGLVAGGTEEGSVLVAGAKGKRQLGEARFHGGAVKALAFSSDGEHLLSAGGPLAAWWDLSGGALLRQVKGPQQITAALLREPGQGAEAYLGTAWGAMVRWPVAQKVAQPLPDLACPALPVPAGRRQLPEAQRCPHGSYLEAEDGSGAACVYPVTAMALAGQTLWRACREGSLHGRELRAGGARHGLSAGFLHTITPRPEGLLLVGRDEGELRILDPLHPQVVEELQPAGTAEVAASAGDLLALAQGDRVRIWVGRSRQASAEFLAGGRVVALALQASPWQVLYLTEDGHARRRALRRP